MEDNEYSDANAKGLHNFCWAISATECGKKVHRLGWPDKAMYIYQSERLRDGIHPLCVKKSDGSKRRFWRTEKDAHTKDWEIFNN